MHRIPIVLLGIQLAACGPGALFEEPLCSPADPQCTPKDGEELGLPPSSDASQADGSLLCDGSTAPCDDTWCEHASRGLVALGPGSLPAISEDGASIAAYADEGLWWMKLGADERELIVPREAGTGYFWLGLTSEQLGMYEVTKDAATGSERFSFAWLDLASKDLHRLDLERWVEPRFSFSADLGGVAYVMKDTSLTPPRSRVFVYERGKEELSRLPLEELGLQGYVLKGWSGLSGNGRYLAFSGVEQESAEEQTDEHDFNDIYLFDRDTAQLSRLGTGDYAALSDDAGIVVLWNSDAHTEREQLRILDRDAGTLMDLCELPEDLPCICSLSGTDLSTAAIPAECREDACPSLTLQAECSMPQVSSDGRHVAFELALHGGSRDASSWRYALAVYDVASGRSALIEATKSMRGTSSDWQLSRDGRFLVFTSSSPTLGVQDGVPNVFLAPLPCFD